MIRLLIWLLLAGVVWWMWRTRSRLPPPARPTPRNTPAEPSSPRLTTMARCAHCGLHLPAPDAVQDAQGRAYCTPAHRDQGPAST